jgi:hypothetical protein
VKRKNRENEQKNIMEMKTKVNKRPEENNVK